MSKNTNKTSKKVAHLASEVLQDKTASTIAKSLAGSALAQSAPGKESSAAMEEKAGKILQSEKYSDITKTLAGSVLSQSNKER